MYGVRKVCLAPLTSRSIIGISDTRRISDTCLQAQPRSISRSTPPGTNKLFHHKRFYEYVSHFFPFICKYKLYKLEFLRFGNAIKNFFHVHSPFVFHGVAGDEFRRPGSASRPQTGNISLGSGMVRRGPSPVRPDPARSGNPRPADLPRSC